MNTHNLDGLTKYSSQRLEGHTGFWFGEVRTCCLLAALHRPTLAEPSEPLSCMLLSLTRGPQEKGTDGGKTDCTDARI